MSPVPRMPQTADEAAMLQQKDIALIRRRLDAIPRIKPPVDSYVQDFSDVTTVSAGFPNTFVTARTLFIPAQKRAVVKYLAIDGPAAAAAFIRFRIAINGQAGINYATPPYVFTNVSQPTEIWVDVDQENTVELQLRNLDMTLPYTVFTRMVAWSWDLNIMAGVR